MKRDKSVTVAPFLIFVLTYAVIGLSFLGSYTLIPGFQIEPSNSAVYIAIWPLFLAGLAVDNASMYLTVLTLGILEVFFQTRIIHLAGNWMSEIRVLPRHPAWKNPLLGLGLTHVLLLSIWLLVSSSKLGISPWTWLQSSITLVPIAIFLILRGIRRLVHGKPHIS